MEWRLRLYTIEAGQLEQWAREWALHIRPLREARGFTVAGAWAADEESTFVWLLGYDGEDGWEAADRAYYASAERAAVEPNPARLIVEAREWPVREV